MKTAIDFLVGIILALVMLVISGCATNRADITCHYEAGVGYVCSGGIGGNEVAM